MAAWACGPSAESSGNRRNLELQSFISSRGSNCHYVRGKFLPIDNVYKILTKNNTKLNESGETMLETLTKVEPHDFQLAQQEFPVSYLQHVTDRESMERIYNQGGFRITKPSSRPGFSDLSFWSAGIATKDVEAACEKSYDYISGMLSPEKAERYEEKIKAQFANSPAFNASASRYGNFKFSFPLFFLLGQYQAQHCGGEEPQLRILGTDMYKQEIAHYILVHSPGKSDQFRDLPMVPTVRSGYGHLPSAYRKGGKLYWRPESTSSILTAMISELGVAWRECPVPCDYFANKGYCRHIREDNYEVWSVWNHLIFAFHLPNNLCLKIPEDCLSKSLTACSIDEPALLEESKCLPIKEAKNIIQEIKSDFRMKKKMRTF